MNILIIKEDDRDIKTLKTALNKKYVDINTYKAKTSKEALKILLSENIDMLIIDMDIENESGLKLTQKIRNEEKYELTPIICIAGDVNNIIHAFKKIHCYDYLVKPYKLEKITEAIEKFKKNIKNENKHVILDIDNENKILQKIDDILFVEYYQKKCKVVTVKNEYYINVKSLEELFKKMNSKNMIQSHRTVIVNKNKINRCEKISAKSWNIHFDEKEIYAPLSYRFKNNFPIIKE